ncbi:ABC transporter permease, partial [Xanthomonas oryzae pv. oryzae]
MSRDIATALPPIPPVRPEYEVALTPLDPALVAAAAPTPWQAPPWLRKALVLVVLVAVWEIAARVIGDDLMLPSALQTARAFYDGLLSGELLRRVGASLRVLAQGYALGVL